MNNSMIDARALLKQTNSSLLVLLSIFGIAEVLNARKHLWSGGSLVLDPYSFSTIQKNVSTKTTSTGCPRS